MTQQMTFDQSDYALLANKVQAAMESGNPSRARLILKENEESFPEEVVKIRSEVFKDYGVRI